jgi:hypothetical protein
MRRALKIVEIAIQLGHELRLSNAISRDMALKRRTIQSWAELRLLFPRQIQFPFRLNVTFLSFRIRDKKLQERGAQ